MQQGFRVAPIFLEMISSSSSALADSAECRDLLHESRVFALQ
jgi:hypothetical protein